MTFAISPPAAVVVSMPRSSDEESSSPPRPNLVPSLRSTPTSDVVPSSPLIGDEDEVVVGTSSPTSYFVPDVGAGFESVKPRTLVIGDEGYLGHLYAALEAEVITEAEWHRADRAHRLVVARRS